MAIKLAIAVLCLAATGTHAQFEWKIGNDGQSCAEVCPDKCVKSIAVATVKDFQAIMANIFPTGSVPCDATQSGDIGYDPSISDSYCGWNTDAGKSAFSCDEKAPQTTMRFCPCGTAGGAIAGTVATDTVKEANLKKVNLPEYKRLKARPAPPAPTAAPGAAPVVAAPLPTAQSKDTDGDTNLGGSGKDAYSIINIESKRALYAVSLGITEADTTNLGASTSWAGSAEQNWRVESAGARNGVETWRITNDVNERRLYALEGTEGPDGKTGVGATASVYAGGDEELWFIISTTGDNTNVGFQFKNVLSNRYLFANSDEHEDAGFGATATPAGKNVDWMMRVQSRALIDGSTVELFHHSFLGGTDRTTEFCIVAETGDSVECNGAGPATSFAKFQFDSVDKASNSWSIKSLALNKYCTAGVAMTCNAITVGAGETFVVEKRPYGALSMKHGELNCKPSPTGISCTAALATDYDNFEARCSNNCADVESLEVKFALSKPVLAANGGTSALPFICGVLLLSFVGGLVYRRLGSERHTSAGFREVELLVE